MIIYIQSEKFTPDVVEPLGFVHQYDASLKTIGMCEVYTFTRYEDAEALIELMRELDPPGFSTCDEDMISSLKY